MVIGMLKVLLPWNFQTGNNPQDCSGYYKSTSGNLTSPNYPSPYPDNADCSYVIAVTSLSYIWVVFHDVQFENGVFDVLEYGVGRQVDKGTMKGRLDSTTEAPFKFKVESDSGVWFHLITDSGVGYRGFALTWNIEGEFSHSQSYALTNSSPQLSVHSKRK